MVEEKHEHTWHLLNAWVIEESVVNGGRSFQHARWICPCGESKETKVEVKI